MDRETYERLIADIGNTYLNKELGAEHFATNMVNNVLIAEGIEIPDPPIIPGVTPGVWMPCCGHDADEGKFYVIANNVRIATVYGLAGNRLLMAGSKGLAEAVIDMFKTWNSGGHGKEARGMLKALKDMGCNVEKFRG